MIMIIIILFQMLFGYLLQQCMLHATCPFMPVYLVQS